MFDFTGRVYAVTGGASGIGLAICEALVKGGASVALLDLPNSDGAAVAARLGARTAFFFAADVSDLSEMEKTATAVEAKMGPVAGFVANAGIAIPTFALDYTPEAWRRTMSINLDGAFFSVQAFARKMAERGGSIVMISSIAGLGVVSPERHAAYGASKAALAHLAPLLGAEWGNRGVRINAVAPGYTDTQILQKMRDDDPETLTAWVSQMPIGRLIRPVEIANAVVFLLSDLASGITGSVLPVNGGYHQ